MQSSALEGELRTVDDAVARDIRDMESWIALIPLHPARCYLWNYARLALRRKQSLFALFQARWARENTRAEAESLTDYLERLRCAYAAAIADKTTEEKAAIETALLQWVQSYDDLLASV